MTKEQVARLVLIAHANGVRKGADIATQKGGGFTEEQRMKHVDIVIAGLTVQARETLYETAQTIITRYTREEAT
jgi:hypothetical protein